MPMACVICNHGKRLEIDREIIQGKSMAGISRKYNVSNVYTIIGIITCRTREQGYHVDRRGKSPPELMAA